jgi:deferrochelatase/peroxidase EfeB
MAGVSGAIAAPAGPKREARSSTGQVPFFGMHQAGITTAAQDRLAFAAFDVRCTRRNELVHLLQRWSAAAALLTSGLPVGPSSDTDTVPADTGETLGLGPARLTITVGFGPSLFDGRFGLAARRPAALAPLPAFPGDDLDPQRSGGDICVQACADDPQVAFHAVRDLARIAGARARMRWLQFGFGRTSSTSDAQTTPRNLMGFKDGTDNITAQQFEHLDRYVWVGESDDQAWMGGGTYAVARRIVMNLAKWDDDELGDQQAVFGRTKASGAPLSGARESDPPDLAAVGADGKPLIPMDAHIRLAAPSTNGGQRILRRGYSFTDGLDPASRAIEAGLFFVAFQRDPRHQFVPIQRRLAHADALNEYIRHTSSALFAVPPGLRGPGDWFGRDLFS